MYTHFILVSHSLADRHLGLSVMHTVRISMYVHISLWYTDLDSFGQIPMSGRTGSYGTSIFSFAGENVNEFSHYGNQYGDPSKKKT